MSAVKKTRIRRLQPGDAIPTTPPRRYVTYHGYVVLRWLVAPNAYVEVHEHRLNAGMPDAAMSVHHINGVKTDNRPENLQVLPPSAHKRDAHGAAWDVASAIADYNAGMSYPAIARKYGIKDSAAVMRVMKNHGHVSRPAPKDMTHCKHWHPFDAANTYIYQGRSRHCRTCAKERAREYRHQGRVA